jgi:uncharacterized protein (DUF433 family)
MNTDPLLSRITVSTDICHGKPCIRGLRYPVEMLRELIDSGMTEAEILADFADLEAEDLRAVELYTALQRRRAAIESGAVKPVPGDMVAAEVRRAVKQIRGE